MSSLIKIVNLFSIATPPESQVNQDWIGLSYTAVWGLWEAKGSSLESSLGLTPVCHCLSNEGQPECSSGRRDWASCSSLGAGLFQGVDLQHLWRQGLLSGHGLFEDPGLSPSGKPPVLLIPVRHFFVIIFPSDSVPGHWPRNPSGMKSIQRWRAQDSVPRIEPSKLVIFLGRNIYTFLLMWFLFHKWLYSSCPKETSHCFLAKFTWSLQQIQTMMCLAGDASSRHWWKNGTILKGIISRDKEPWSWVLPVWYCMSRVAKYETIAPYQWFSCNSKFEFSLGFFCLFFGVCVWYWDLNSGPTPWATPPVFFCKAVFQNRV
jgi:hypothetical protein